MSAKLTSFVTEEPTTAPKFRFFHIRHRNFLPEVEIWQLCACAVKMLPRWRYFRSDGQNHCHCYVTTVMLCVSAEEEEKGGASDVKIFASGKCIWYREFQLSISHCPIDITWFPFDDQRCNLIYESKTHESKELNFTAMFPAVVLDLYTHNGEWELIGMQQAISGSTVEKTRDASCYVVTLN